MTGQTSSSSCAIEESKSQVCASPPQQRASRKRPRSPSACSADSSSQSEMSFDGNHPSAPTSPATSRSQSSDVTASSQSSAVTVSSPYSSRYRHATLRSIGIDVEESRPYWDVLPASISSHVQQLESAWDTFALLSHRMSFAEINQSAEGSADTANKLVSQAQDVVRRVLRILGDDPHGEKEMQRFWDSRVYVPLEDDPDLCVLFTLRWTTRFPSTAEEGSFIAKSAQLPSPEPGVSIGIRLDKKDRLKTDPPFHTYWQERQRVNGRAIMSLEEDFNTKLHPRPSESQPLAYPAFVHEIKSGGDGHGLAANQLATSLAFALDQQEELRLLAGAPVEERMPVFGAASSGFSVRLWCAAYVEDRITIVDVSRELELRWPSCACAYLKFTQELRTWLLSTYAPRIIAWLDLALLNAKARASTASAIATGPEGA